MMSRKEFVRDCVAAVGVAGFCCAGKAHEAVAVAVASQTCDPQELGDVNNRAEAARLRFSKLVQILEARLPERERKQVLHELGGKCADTYRTELIDQYKGNIRGFLEEGRRLWMAEADYDEAKGTIRIVDKGPSCSCPMVKVGATPGSFCDCTLGWQEEAYSVILGQPVKAELEESILRGGKRCVYRIRLV